MYKDFDAGFEGGFNNQSDNSTTLQADRSNIDLPDASYIRDAEITRDGMDLVLDGPNGEIVVEGYFSAAEAPTLSADGVSLSPELVNSFVKSTPEYAKTSSMTDESPVGAVSEVSGEASVTRTDGSVETVQMGTPIYQGDIVETNADGAINITFSDDSSFAVSENARLAIDEYVFDPASEAGTQSFSVLKGVFVFTSGLIGRDDPDDVGIDTPMGSIGIRGTIIAGDVDAGEITVVEGAIVLRDFDGNEVTLASQFETATFKPGEGIEHNGQKAANDVADKFVSVSKVAPSLFSSINDAAAESIDEQGINDGPDTEEMLDDAPDVENLDNSGDEADADGSVDQNADNQVDGTVDDDAARAGSEDEAAGDDGNTDGEGALDGSPGDGHNNIDLGLGNNDGGFGDNTGGLGNGPGPNNGGPNGGSAAGQLGAGGNNDPFGDVFGDNDGNRSDSGNEDSTGSNINDGTTDPNANQNNDGPQFIDIGTLEDSPTIGGTIYKMADQGGVTYAQPDGGSGGIFTNLNVGADGILDTGDDFHHQDLSFRGSDGNEMLYFEAAPGGELRIDDINLFEGNDEVIIHTPDSSANIDIGAIHGDSGNDIFKFDFGNVANVAAADLDIGLLHGGVGEDTLFIRGDVASVIDFRNVGDMRSIETINSQDGQSQQITLTLDQVLSMAEYNAGTDTYEITFDVSTGATDGYLDMINIDTDGETRTGPTDEGAYDAYTYIGAAENGADLKVLITDNAVITDI